MLTEIGRDQNLTLAQNYRRLGLASKLNARTGGIEQLASQASQAQNPSAKLLDPLSLASKIPTTLNPTEARIERDPSTRAIIRVIRPHRPIDPLKDPLNSHCDEQNGLEENDAILKGRPAGIVQELEEQASMEMKKRPRQQSEREQEWITGLVRKHGDDYGRMARDRRLNPYQQGEADLRRRVNLWKQKSSSLSEV